MDLGTRRTCCRWAWLSSYFLFFLRRQEQFQRNPDSYNGAVRENYTWSQDYTDLELKVPVPKHVVKGKQVTAGVLLLPAFPLSCYCCSFFFFLSVLGHTRSVWKFLG